MIEPYRPPRTQVALHRRVGETTCACGHEARNSHTLGAHIGGAKRSKLTRDQVVEIKRQLRAGVVTQREIARRHGLNKSTISHMMTGRSWKHVE